MARGCTTGGAISVRNAWNISARRASALLPRPTSTPSMR